MLHTQPPPRPAHRVATLDNQHLPIDPSQHLAIVSELNQTLSDFSMRAPYKFDDFYSAFGRSVSADVVFEDGQVHIVRRDRSALGHTDDASPQHSGSPATVDAALPTHVAALLELQQPDGSWQFDEAFAFALNGVAPGPIDGISSRLWATAIAICVWRQAPESFALLEAAYTRAMLHADETVVKLAKTHLDFNALHKIRFYRSEQARALKEQRAREAAAQRRLEDEEYERARKAKEDELHVTELSLAQARRLPKKTQKLIVSSLNSEVKRAFRGSSAEDVAFAVGDTVECCFRRPDGGATRAVKHNAWYPCRLTSIDAQRRTANVEFLDGDQERTRGVPFNCLRLHRTDGRAARDAKFTSLATTWLRPTSFEDEIVRLQEIQAKNAQRSPWDTSVSLTSSQPAERSPHKSPVKSRSEESRPRSRSRPLILRPLSSSGKARNTQLDELFQAAVAVLLPYDRALDDIGRAAREGCQAYANAALFRERFHAFDAFNAAVVELAERTVDALDAVAKWKAQTGQPSSIFVWHGRDLVLSVVGALNGLGGYPELVEWFGDEFPFEMNPFLLGTTLADKASDMGLAVLALPTGNALQAALRKHKRSAEDNTPPTWWPETHYSQELKNRIPAGEQFLLRELVARGAFGIPLV